MRKFVYLALFSVLLLCTTGCTDNVEDVAYKSMAIAGITYNAVMKSASTAEKSGMITTTERAEINHYGQIYHDSYHAACDVFKDYLKLTSPNDSDAQKVFSAMAAAAANLSTLTDFARSVGLVFEEAK
ncbi:MAG: hypothetical protein ACNI27_08515 [Desulfovibrio sp.]